MELEGKIAAVTGGAMGIGQAVSLAFAQEGAHVAILDIDPAASHHTAAQIERLGRQALVCECDVSRAAEVDEATQRIVRTFGRADILVNNAGISHPSVSILELDLEWLDRVTGVDLKGVYFCARRIGREMVQQGSGVIINIASIAGLTPLPLPVYGPIKSGVIMLTQILARDFAEHGVRVNAIAPGYVLTPLLQGMFDRGERNPDTVLRSVPMKAFVMPSDIAQAAVFLCSEKARYITGVTLPVDGGFLSQGGWRAYGYE
jgi:NAD(P)-dependent dehydrogenase (short-subunit alcohol dehydrogenase family)